jgi:S-DNA-T family DNA segregation ATPase FtsK/SpoIIIE
VDWKSACSKIAVSSKSSWRASANSATAVLDGLSPAAAPFAARWDAEADRRNKLRTQEHLKALMDAQRAHNSARSTAATARSQRTAARKASKNPVSAARRAARTADKAALKGRRSAKTGLKTARRNYPDTLKKVAVKAHAAHVLPAGVTSYALSTPADWAVWPASVSIAVVAANVGALWLGRRSVSVQVEDGVSAEERRLMERLDPSWWVQHAEERGLSGTLTERPEITPAGIVCGVRLDGKGWSAKKLAAEAAAVRALLGMKTATRMQISDGSHGDRARIVIRTRSASDGVSMIWTPEHKGIGVDEVTGELVDVPMAGTHKLIAGVTNMGKSVSWRPWMMQAVADPLWAGILLDPKRLEARMWHGKIRTEGHQRGSNEEVRQAIYDAIRELVAQMQHRQEIADVTQWVPSPEYPNLLVVIEEGRQILQMAKDNRWSDILDLIDDLYTLARATGIWIIWATQYPSRTNGGVTAMVSENSLTVMSLTVDSPVSDRVVYGENAATSGWEPSKLASIPGRALVKHKDRKPNPVRIWHVKDDAISALPDVTPWQHRTTKAPAPAAPTAPRLTLLKGESAEVPAPRSETPALTDTEAAVLDAVRSGATRQKDVVETSGIAKGTVSKAVRRLVEAGHLTKTEDGTLTTTAKEATA